MSSQIRILVAIDFGTMHSSFAYVHKENSKNVETNSSWPGREGCFTVPTALQYDESYSNVISWGHLALDPDDSEEQRSRYIELFKLPWLPPQLDYKKVIEDYLTQMRILIKETLEKRWPTVIFPQQIEFVLTIPTEWPPHTAIIMRECAYKAGLLTSLDSNQLEFIIEYEAVALHCLNVINLQPGDSFIVADCGDEKVDLTTRKLLPGNKLGEITQREGDLCGSTLVDKEFLLWLGKKVGFQALEKLKSNYYGQMQHLMQQFFGLLVKFKFSGEPTEYKNLRLNLRKYCPDLPQCATGESKKKMEDEEWVLKIDFHSVREMFDPVVNRVIKLINHQLKSSDEECSAIFLVGGFSESPYLLRRIRETFKSEVGIIATPVLPVVAKVRGAIAYGLSIINNERPMTSDEPHEIIGKLGIGFNKINNKLTNLLEENQMLKEERQEILRINLELKEELQEKDKKFEDFQQYVLNLEKQKNDEIQQLKIITRNLEKNLEILELVEISEDDH